MLITLPLELIQVSNQKQVLGEAIWSQPENISFITYQTQKLRSQRIMVKTTLQSDSPGRYF